MHIDHVLIGTADLEAAGERLLNQYGLASVRGGRHEGWGTANRIVPLGRSYLEIIGVIDPAEASRNFLGTYLQEHVSSGDRFIGWVLATDNIEATAARLGVDVVEGSRARPDGEILRWHLAGLSEAFSSGYLPFFIRWDVPPELHPARMKTEHRVQPQEILSVAVTGNVTELSTWLGGRLPPWVQAFDGPPGIDSVSIATADRREAITIQR